MVIKLCEVCTQEKHKYSCPKCGILYCSKNCYQAHSGKCTESFYKQQIKENADLLKPDIYTKRRTLEVVKQYSPYIQSHDEEGSKFVDIVDNLQQLELQEEEEQKFLEQLKNNNYNLEGVQLEDLPKDWQEEFQEVLTQKQDLHKYIDDWQPWWKNGDVYGIKLNKGGQYLVQEYSPHMGDQSGPISKEIQYLENQDQETSHQRSANQGALIHGGSILKNLDQVNLGLGDLNQEYKVQKHLQQNTIPNTQARGPTPKINVQSFPQTMVLIPPLGTLTGRKASRSVKYIMIRILLAYCFTLRAYHGDIRDDILEASYLFHSLLVHDQKLEQNMEQEDLKSQSIIQDFLEIQNGTEFQVSSDFGKNKKLFALLALDDVAQILEIGHVGIILSLQDCYKLFEDSIQLYKQEKYSKRPQKINGTIQKSDLEQTLQDIAVQQNPKNIDYIQQRLQEDPEQFQVNQSLRNVSGGTEYKRSLRQCQRKILYYLCWTNEQVEGTFQDLSNELQKSLTYYKQNYQ